jgi:hypothetical protein
MAHFEQVGLASQAQDYGGGSRLGMKAYRLLEPSIKACHPRNNRDPQSEML